MIDLAVNARSMNLLAAAMKAADKKTTNTAVTSTRQMAYFVARSLGAGTKPQSMARKREAFDNPSYPKTRGKFLIQVLRQEGPPALLPTNRKSDKRRIIQRLGLAASSFRSISGKFGKRPSGKKIAGAHKYGRGYFIRKGKLGKAQIVSYLSYIFAAFPGVVDTAMRKGLTSFIRQFDRDWASALKEGRG